MDNNIRIRGLQLFESIMNADEYKKPTLQSMNYSMGILSHSTKGANDLLEEMITVVILSCIHSILGDCTQDTTLSNAKYVDSEYGSDTYSCTYSYKCKTLSRAYSQLSNSAGTVVLLKGTHSVSAGLSSSKTITIQSCNPDEETILSVSGGITLFSLSSQTLTLTGFSIAVTSADCLFKASGSNNYLTLESMKIYGVDQPRSISHLVYVYDKMIEFRCISSFFSNFQTSTYPLFRLSYETNTSNSYPDDICQTIVVEDSQFEDISGSNSVFHYRPGHSSVSLSRLSFARCTSSGDGGAVFSYHAGMKISSCSFANCAANNGGAIYWRPQESPSGQLTSLTFCNNEASSGSGHDIYVTGYTADSACFSACISYTRQSSTLYNNRGTTTYIEVKNEDCPCDIDNSGRSCVDDIDDFIVEEECARGGDPSRIQGMIVVFVTDVFWQLSIRSISTVMILSIVSVINDHTTTLLLL